LNATKTRKKRKENTYYRSKTQKLAQEAKRSGRKPKTKEKKMLS